MLFNNENYFTSGELSDIFQTMIGAIKTNLNTCK